MAFGNISVLYLRSAFVSATVGGTRISALDDVADAGNSTNTTVTHPSNSATRRVAIPNQASAISAPSSAYGFAIAEADMGSVAGARRFFKAGTHTAFFYASGGNTLGSNTYRLTAYRVGVSPGFTKTIIGAPASATGSGLGASVSIPLSLPEIIFEPGETILYALDDECNPGALTGTTTYVLGTGTALQGNEVSRITTPRLSVLADTQGSSTGSGDAVGIPVVVVPAAGASTGTCTVDGFPQSIATSIGISQGTAALEGYAATVSSSIGVAEGTADAVGRAAAVIGAVGSVDIGGGGGGTTIYKRPVYVFGN